MDPIPIEEDYRAGLMEHALATLGLQSKIFNEAYPHTEAHSGFSYKGNKFYASCKWMVDEEENTVTFFMKVHVLRKVIRHRKKKVLDEEIISLQWEAPIVEEKDEG